MVTHGSSSFSPVLDSTRHSQYSRHNTRGSTRVDERNEQHIPRVASLSSSSTTSSADGDVWWLLSPGEGGNNGVVYSR